MSPKTLITLVLFVGGTAFGMWYFEDTRTPEERAGRNAVAPDR
jgi:hypothetical protein